MIALVGTVSYSEEGARPNLGTQSVRSISLTIYEIKVYSGGTSLAKG